MEILTKCKTTRLINLPDILSEWNGKTKKKPANARIILPDEVSEAIQHGIIHNKSNKYIMLVWVDAEEFNNIDDIEVSPIEKGGE